MVFFSNQNDCFNVDKAVTDTEEGKYLDLVANKQVHRAPGSYLSIMQME